MTEGDRRGQRVQYRGQLTVGDGWPVLARDRPAAVPTERSLPEEMNKGEALVRRLRGARMLYCLRLAAKGGESVL